MYSVELKCVLARLPGKKASGLEVKVHRLEQRRGKWRGEYFRACIPNSLPLSPKSLINPSVLSRLPLRYI